MKDVLVPPLFVEHGIVELARVGEAVLEPGLLLLQRCFWLGSHLCNRLDHIVADHLDTSLYIEPVKLVDFVLYKLVIQSIYRFLPCIVVRLYCDTHWIFIFLLIVARLPTRLDHRLRQILLHARAWYDPDATVLGGDVARDCHLAFFVLLSLVFLNGTGLYLWGALLVLRSGRGCAVIGFVVGLFGAILDVVTGGVLRRSWICNCIVIFRWFSLFYHL